MFAESMVCMEEEGAQDKKKRRAAARSATDALQWAREEAAPS
jgi:hypothetical protein